MPSRSKKEEIGYIVSWFSGVGRLEGLPGVSLHEVLVDERGEQAAVVVGFSQRGVEVLFLKEDFDLEKPLFRSFQSLRIPVSSQILGRVIGGLGQALDGLGEIEGEGREVFGAAPGLAERQAVSRPLITGIKVIDTTLPLGRGQRELIIGDRKLGKTSLALDVVLNQKKANPPVYCVYVICGQKRKKLAEVVDVLERYEALSFTVVVAATASSPLAEQFLAPFVGCAIGEYFRDQGKDALVVYDDLSQHAKVYRSICLLLERPPGRESYPGDIFSLHAGLLERAAQLNKKMGGGSLTALPIVETQEDDITSFIPTNLISITDGQIYLQRGLFQKGFLPPVNVGLSVSRVGGRAQPKILRKVTGGIRLSLAQYRELYRLSQLETEISKEARERIMRGGLLLQLLRQEKHRRVDWEEQAVLFYAATQGFLDELIGEENERWEELFCQMLRNQYSFLLVEIRKGRFDQELKLKIRQMVEDFKQEFWG